MEKIIDNGDFQAFTNVFEKCEITATNRVKTTCNALSYRSLMPKHIQFLVDRGLDVNADCGFATQPLIFMPVAKKISIVLLRMGQM